MLKKIKTIIKLIVKYIENELLTLPNPIKLLYFNLINRECKNQIMLLKQNGISRKRA